MTENPSYPTAYEAPVTALTFTLDAIAGLEHLRTIPTYADFSDEMVSSILQGAAAFAEERLAPLNGAGDREGCHIDSEGNVSLPSGFAKAYQDFIADGWHGAPFASEHGGMGLPACVNAALQEIWHSANLSFALIPLLTQGAVHVVAAYGNDWQKRLVLPKLVSGEWSGTMCLTEPQAGSDVGAARTRAVAQGDGSYRIKGGKIFISAGDHDACGNIIHLVLARLPDAPEGTKGLSLFLAPKFLVNEDGSLGARNDLRAISLEHKLGMHASPTITLALGDNEGAVGYLLGEANQGMKAMFVMMNSARLAVGLEGLGIAEAATQTARRYAETRIQGRRIATADKVSVPIAQHPDVQRMLAFMASHVQGLRSLSVFAATATDLAASHPNEAERQKAQARVDLLTPIVKAHTTNLAFTLASEAVQVHGGAGYLEETGVAQYLRDIRVAMIYEGTNGIQALDLALRKLAADDGAALQALLSEAESLALSLSGQNDYRLLPLGNALTTAIGHARQAAQSMLDQIYRTQNNQQGDAPAAASAVPFLTLLGLVLEGYLLAKGAAHAAALETQSDSHYNAEFLANQIGLARFFLSDTILDTLSLRERVANGDIALKVMGATKAQA